MSVLQYLRKASLIIGPDAGDAVELSALRFRFSVKRGDLQTPNTADIRVYNVNDDTALKAEKEFTRIVIQAGYEGNFGVIFDGTIKQIRRGRESPTDTYLDITAADGDSAYNFSTVAVSLAAGSKPDDHVNVILQGMTEHGVSRGYIQPVESNGLPRGKVIFGMTKDELREVARNTNTNWSIQDGKLQMVGINAYLPGEAVVVNAATGMIGQPEATQNGIRVKTLLNPNIKIGGVIKLNNKDIQQYRYGLSVSQQVQNEFARLSTKTNDDGMYYVMIADHSGDTRGGDWYSDLICLSIDTSIPLSYVQKQGVPDAGPVKPYG
ncbi:MAG: hypothetical protein ABFC42_09225 [Sulfuricella sp.]